MPLSEDILKKKQSIEPRIEESIDELKQVGAVLEVHSSVSKLENLALAIHEEIFNLGVVGRFNNGKSSLINLLLLLGEMGNSFEQDPLPVGRFPTTAVCTNMVASDHLYITALHRDGTQEKVDPDRFYTKARVQNGDQDWLEDIDVFNVGFNGKLLQSGTSIIDTPGDDEDPRRSAITRAALERTDAAIVIYNTQAIAGQGEQNFAAEVSSRVGKVLTVINVLDGHEVDQEMINAVAERLGHLDADGKALDLSEKDIFFVNVKMGLDGVRQQDNRLVRESGILAFEQRLSDFLLDERYSARTTRIVQQIDEEAHSLLRHQLGQLKDLNGEITIVEGEITDNLERIKQSVSRRDNMASLINEAETDLKSEARRSFELAIRTTEGTLEQQFSDSDIPGLDKFWGRVKAGFGKGTSDKAAEILQNIVIKDIQRWSENPPHLPGLQRDLEPRVKRLQRDLRRESEELYQSLNSVDLEISSSNVNVNTGDAQHIGVTDRIIGAVLGTIVFGPVGAVAAAGGTRAAVGGVVGGGAGALTVGLVSSFVTLLTGPVGWAAIVATAIAGGIAGPAVGVEKRIRKKAIEAYKPVLHAYINAESTYDEIERNIASGVAAFRVGLLNEVDRHIDSQRESLEASQRSLGLSREEKVEKTKVLEQLSGKIKSAQTRLNTILKSL